MEFDSATTKKRLFISPLDWGLGHASRLVPLIADLRDQGHFILLGTEPKTAVLQVINRTSHLKNLLKK